MLEGIPEELRLLHQWVAASSNKVPINPRTGARASVVDQATWGTFEQATNLGLPYVGFVLTSKDPYICIDLDDKPDHPATEAERAAHHRILEAFDTYIERSVSKRGYHVLLKGEIERSVRRGSVEVYHTGRYIICTGDTVKNRPIKKCQELLNSLVGEIGVTASSTLIEEETVLDDALLVATAEAAANGEKFLNLCKGDWARAGYRSQSEADFALLSILAYYTRSNSQVRRLFRYSGLGKREKATRNDTYLDTALRKIRASEAPRVTVEDLIRLPDKLPEEEKDSHHITYPPGLVGTVAEHIFTTAIRPVREVALVAAIGLIAGIAGRSYNISGTGLNQYLILLAKTGVGKEGIATGIDTIIASVRKAVPAIDEFIGPAAFASGQALIRMLDTRKSFVSVLGEFGLTLQQLCDARASPANVMLKKVMLDLYGKSGFHQVLRASVYSDTEKNTNLVQAPSVTILGESTPEAFFDGLGQNHIAEGLIPRFMVVNAKTQRPKRNKNFGGPPGQGLVDDLIALALSALSSEKNGTCTNVELTKDAEEVLDALDEFADERINAAAQDIEAQLWNRAHLKALKLAGLVAVGENHLSPVVQKAHAVWAVSFVRREIEGMLQKYAAGDIGPGEHRLEADVRRAVEAYFTMSEKQLDTYKIPQAIRGAAVIPFHFIRRRVRQLSSFQNDRRGAAKALEETLRDMSKALVLLQMHPLDSFARYHVKTELYSIGPAW